MKVISVVLTDHEYERLHRKCTLLASGNVMGALRLEAGLAEFPRGYRKWQESLEPLVTVQDVQMEAMTLPVELNMPIKEGELDTGT